MMLIASTIDADRSTMPTPLATKRPAAARLGGGANDHLPSPTSGSRAAANANINAARGSARATEYASARMYHQA